MTLGYPGDEQSASSSGNTVLGGIGDIQWCSVVAPLHSGVRDSVQAGVTVKEGKAKLIDCNICWGCLDDWRS